MAGLLFLGLDVTGDWRAEGQANPDGGTETDMSTQPPSEHDMVTLVTLFQLMKSFRFIRTLT